MTQDELIIKRFCEEYKIKLNKLDSYERYQRGYVVNSEGRIEVLNLHALEINKLPEYIAELSELKILHLVLNELTSIKEIGNLTKLETLNIRFNEITNISVVEGLKNLKKFHADDNPITDITPLKHLEKLEILSTNVGAGMDLNTVNFPNLVEVSLFNVGQFANLSFLRSCKNIKSLNIWGTYDRKKLSNEIFDNIKHLDLSDLCISNISQLNTENILFFPRLKSLFISSSDLSDIHFLYYLTELEILNLSYNRTIKNILPISKLTKLKKLDLSDNKIKDITPLKHLIHLKIIDLRKNPIKDLQPILDFNLPINIDRESGKSEQEIYIFGCNEITNPPIDIVKQGDEAIRRYFKKIEEEGFDYIYEAKLILVGQGDSGKTSLQKRLRDEKADLPKKEERTRGIEVVDFEFEKGKIAHIWDFGGQVVYYPVHRFFITENSVFVLLASTRHDSHNFEYWLPTIFKFGGKSPVIIGQTCHDGNTVPWNDLNIYFSNPNFKIIRTLDEPYYEINLPDNNKGLNTIKECITSQIKNLHHFGKPVPKSWSKVRNTIREILLDESKTHSYISFQSFSNLCKELEPERFKNREDIEDCCNFLHNIGVILWYSKIEELKSWVILKPDWAMSAVYKIIDDGDIQKNNGQIRPDDFTRLWNDKSDEEHVILKKMLETFMIAFPTKHHQGQYILPARLIAIPLEKRWKAEENSLHLEYKFEFMPKGIVNQLSAELSRYIQGNEVWNNAVNLTVNDAKSQIFEDAYNRTLSIMSKGINAQGINVLIMDKLKNIIESYKGVKEEIIVKCPCKDCQESETPSSFSYDQLIEKLRKKDNATVTCNRSDEVFNILELLYNVGLKKKETQSSSKETSITRSYTKNITIFLASSEELKEEREQFEIFIYRETKEYIEKGIFFKLEIWEDFIDRISETRLQDEYNKAVINSDIFIGLFWTKTGKYTKEEFSEAYNHFKKTGKPSIYTYFNTSPVNPQNHNTDSIHTFREELKALGHFPTSYDNIDDLKNKFRKQLQKILPSLI